MLLRDYHFITNVKPGEGRPDVFGLYEGINKQDIFFTFKKAKIL
jgi:hypothetical protein